VAVREKNRGQPDERDSSHRPLLSLSEAAEYLGGGVDARYIRTRIYSPPSDPSHLPSIKIGKRRFIHPDDIDALIARKVAERTER
jgi:hypothetical protein